MCWQKQRGVGNFPQFSVINSKYLELYRSSWLYRPWRRTNSCILCTIFQTRNHKERPLRSTQIACLTHTASHNNSCAAITAINPASCYVGWLSFGHDARTRGREKWKKCHHIRKPGKIKHASQPIKLASHLPRRNRKNHQGQRHRCLEVLAPWTPPQRAHAAYIKKLRKCENTKVIRVYPTKNMYPSAKLKTGFICYAEALFF